VLVVCLAGVVAAIMRFVAFIRVKDFKDFSYEEIEPLSWTVAESGIYMVAGVLPTLRPLVKKIFPGVDFDKVLGGSSRGTGNEGYGVNKKWTNLVIKKDTKMSSDASSTRDFVITEDEERGLASKDASARK
jgi:hypothetical protein